MNYPNQRLKEDVIHYWNERSQLFSKDKIKELHSSYGAVFRDILKNELGSSPLNVIDIGCGSGFLSLLLAQLGHRVTGVDLSPEMISISRKLATQENQEVDFLVMDAENLNFNDHTFDLVISRNLTWTLPHPEKAYQEWIRILKPNGKLINFDSDLSGTSFENIVKPQDDFHNNLLNSQINEVERLRQAMTINHLKRPEWDLQILKEEGMSIESVQPAISDQIYKHQVEYFNQIKLFMIVALKKDE